MLRLVLSPLSFNFDLGFFVITSAGFESGRTLYEVGNFYYPPVYGYLLSFFTYVWNLFPLQSGGVSELLLLSSRFSDFQITYISSIALSVAYTIPLMMIDLACSWLIYVVVKEKTGDKRKAEIGFALFFLSPLVIWTSAVAGMFDSLSAFFMIFSIYTLTKKQYALSGAMISLGIFTKVFPIVIGFAVICYIISRSEGKWKHIFKNSAKYAFGFLLATTMVLLPLALNGEMSFALGSAVNRMSHVSTAGAGIWDFLINPTHDKFAHVFPVILILIAVFSMLSFMRHGDDDKKLVMASTISISMLFMWPPVPTYPVIAIAMFALAVTYCGRKEWMIPWTLFSIVMVLHHISIFGPRILYTLANVISFLDLSNVVESFLHYAQLGLGDSTLILLYIPCLSSIFVTIYTLKYHKKVDN